MNSNYEMVKNQIIESLLKYKGLYSNDYFLEFESRIEQMHDKIVESLEEGRKLKIGIVGEVKAGKSSFLNSLIFGGEDILPKASTPMTAALTKISYSEKSEAKIVFYNVKDWERVERYSEEYHRKIEELYANYVENISRNNSNFIKKPLIKTREEMKSDLEKSIPLSMVSCNELVELARNGNIDIYEHLGKSTVIDLKDINEYIGAYGKFTPIVKHVELKINNKYLQDIEIIDTPGLNDPIISRGESTKKFLGNCDVVFLLSYCGQFLTQEDISFMRETLPNEGVRNIVLVGSKFDSGILDYNKSNSFKDAFMYSRSSYNKMAENNISKCIINDSSQVLEYLRDSLPPSYVSSLFYSCAVKMKNNKELSEMENLILKEMQKRFYDFRIDYKYLLSSSGIEQIKKDKLEKIYNEKSEIISKKNKTIIGDNKSILLQIIEDINIQALQNYTDIQSFDKNNLETRLKNLQYKLNSVRQEILNIFNTNLADAELFLSRMSIATEMEIDNYLEIEVKESTHTVHSTISTGWFGLKKEHYRDVITTYTASISDVIANIRKYITRCKLYLNEEFDKVVNINKLKRELTSAVIEAFELSDKNFNENDILIPLEIVLRKIQIPKIDIEAEHFETMLIDAFSSTYVKNEDIHELKLHSNRVFGEVSKVINMKLEDHKKLLNGVISEQSVSFIDNIINQMTKNMEFLKEQIENKEESMKKYDAFFVEIQNYKKQIKEMEL